ncbi:hypothetical protein ACWY4P_53675 (plasmid) [Streptomyces sp. LZ34]
MGASENQQPADSAAAAACDECGTADDTVRDMGLRTPIQLCDPCFDDLIAIRTLAGPLPLSRVLDDVLTGADPLEAGRRSDTWRRTAPAAEPADDEREDRTA